jgi:hypothetical protein
MAQNIIKKTAIANLGYGFIGEEYIPKGKDEYYLRDIQDRSGINYRKLTAYEIEVLVRNRNTSDDWNKILVSDAFNPELVKNCKFFGLVRIGKLEAFCLTFSDLKTPVGLYNSTIISCDFGDNVVVDNVNYLSHYIIGNEVIIANVNELVTTNHTKFGVGIVKDGEKEDVRIWIELCNENGGRKVMPFNGMLPGDAYLWSKYRDDDALLQKFKEFTEKEFKPNRGFYGKIGDRTVIKNCSIIKDVWIGSDAYIKGANKLKNLTINSGEKGRTQIGEGCELVNGIVGFGCTIFYGVKAVRFIMASNSQLKYGARLINSYLGNNATISCCEVLNSLIFPAHEQHHNNSFLCAALVMGQSNIAAGATIGSNHNSRGADGEVVMGRGFWPGLCVSIKHNSKFASFTILTKGDYPSELNIPIPFSLVSMDAAKDQLTIMPGYWFMYNMYALARNSWKYVDRDKREDKIQHIEYDYLAPDTINELFSSMQLLEELTGNAFFKKFDSKKAHNKEEKIAKGKSLLIEQSKLIDELEIIAENFENSKRKTVLIKVSQSYVLFREMIQFYGVSHLIHFIQQGSFKNITDVIQALPSYSKRDEWLNIGGQLMNTTTVEALKQKVKTGKIKSWDGLHDFYTSEGTRYEQQKFYHALASLAEINQLKLKKIDHATISKFLNEAVATKEWMAKSIHTSRAKDYSNPYRKMVYETQKEMDNVIGKLSDNSFIQQQAEDAMNFKKEIAALKRKLKLK